MTPEDLDRARRFVQTLKWKHTMALAEHWYSLPDWAPDQDERRWFVALIGTHGYKGQAFGMSFKYLELGGQFRYWLSKVWTAPADDLRPMINRGKLADVQEPQLRLDIGGER